MVVLNVPVNNCTPQTIVIGRRGTYDTMQIAFDLSYLVESYGNGVAVLAVKRSQDESAYPAVITQEDNTLTWTVSETDTAYVGAGECQLMWYVDGGLAKTIIYQMVVMRDILQTAEEPPEGYQTWVDTLVAEGAKTLKNAQDAAQSASEAKVSEDNAEESAQRAEEAAELLTNVSATATTLEPGQEATAEYNEGVFEFGIPKGDKLTYADLTEADKDDLVQGPIKDAQNDAVEAVGNAGTTQVQNVNNAGTTQTDAVNLAGTTNVNAVNQAGEAQVNAVNQAGATQVQAVEDKGDEVIASIPPDYSGLSDEVDNLNRHLSDLEDTVSTTQIINTASGAIASFSDGANGQPIRKLVAQIEPVQDLHGYDHPWPAGGGKNLLGDDYVTNASGETSHILQDYKLPTQGGTYTCSAKANGVTINSSVCSVNYKNSSNEIVFNLSPGATKEIPDLSTVVFVEIYTAASLAGQRIQLQTEAGTVATTYEPVSNICPISGWTGVNGQNTANAQQWDEEWEAGAISTSNGSLINVGGYIRSKNYIPVASGKTYYRAGEYVSDGRAFFYGQDKSFISHTSISAVGAFDIPYNACFMKLHKNGASYNNNISINYPATDTKYHPYTGNQISVTFPETIYGGEGDIIGGKYVSDMGYIPDLGTLTWTKYNVDQGTLFRAAIPLIKKITNTAGKIKLLCSAYPYVAQNVRSDKTCSVPTNSANVDIIDNRYSDAESFKTAMSGVQLCYELAEPVEYTMTGNEMETLYGTNNIWADTGDVEVEYPCDTRLFIEKLTQPTEDDMTADHAIASGTFFMIGNTLYLATSQIAAGGTITPGTNATQLSLADALNQLNT